MAEAIAVVSFVSASASLINASSKMVKRLNDFQSETHYTPQIYHHVQAILPITITGLEKCNVGAHAGPFDSETQKALVPALEHAGTKKARELSLFRWETCWLDCREPQRRAFFPLQQHLMVPHVADTSTLHNVWLSPDTFSIHRSGLAWYISLTKATGNESSKAQKLKNQQQLGHDFV